MNLELLKKELMRDEGVRRDVYIDTCGHQTCGIGYNLDARALPCGVTLPLSDEEIEILYKITIEDVFKGLNRCLPWWRDLDDVRQRVLANMCFNLGIYGLLGFKNTLFAIKNCEYTIAAKGMRNSKWYRQVGQRAERLAKGMESGVMPCD